MKTLFCKICFSVWIEKREISEIETCPYCKERLVKGDLCLASDKQKGKRPKV